MISVLTCRVVRLVSCVILLVVCLIVVQRCRLTLDSSLDNTSRPIVVPSILERSISERGLDKSLLLHARPNIQWPKTLAYGSANKPIMIVHREGTTLLSEYTDLMTCYASKHNYQLEVCNVQSYMGDLHGQFISHRKWICFQSVIEKMRAQGRNVNSQWLCAFDHDMYITAEHMTDELEDYLSEAPDGTLMFLRGNQDMNTGFLCFKPGINREMEIFFQLVIEQLIHGPSHFSDQQAFRHTFLKLVAPTSNFRPCVMNPAKDWWKGCDDLFEQTLHSAGYSLPMWNWNDAFRPFYFRPELPDRVSLHGNDPAKDNFAFHLAGMVDKSVQSMSEGNPVLEKYSDAVEECKNTFPFQQ